MEALIAMGDEAVAALEQAEGHKDPEVRARARRALHRIRWRISRELSERVGDLMFRFEQRSVGERDAICRSLALVGRTDAVPTLSQILKTDPSGTVRQGAAKGLVLLGDAGLEALLEAGVKTEGLNPYTIAVRIHVGNRHLEAKEFEKALAQYRRVLELDARNSIAHYNIACTYAQMERIDEALDALETSVECGYRDVDWMEKDADLDNLRDLPRYKALVKRLRDEEDVF
jgi:tetratricopeptide (TPR) repeat protein